MRAALAGTALAVLSLLATMTASQTETNPPGRVEIGKVAWVRGTVNCKNCHGIPITMPPGTESLPHQDGEGGSGPDLAGRKLTFSQFTRAVRQPWGIMPRFNERQISDQTLADMYAYMMSLPPVQEPGKPRYPLPPPGSPPRQRLIVTNGCVSCHRPEMRDPRQGLGGNAADVNWEFFKARVYDHTSAFPDGNMGNFSRARLPEPTLREIFHFVVDDLGLIVPMTAVLEAAKPEDAGTTFTMTIENGGTAGKGLVAEEVTVSLFLPRGAEVVTTTGAGYQGVRHDPETSAAVAVWQVPKIGPAEKQLYSVTLANSAATVKMFAGSVVNWVRPDPRVNHLKLIMIDDRFPEKGGDSVNVTLGAPVQVSRTGQPIKSE